MASLTDLGVVLGAAVLLLLRATFLPQLCQTVTNDISSGILRLNRRTFVRGVLLDLVETPFTEEGFFRGVPWIIFLLFSEVFAPQLVALGLGLVFFLVLNWVWAMLHLSPDRKMAFLAGLIFGGLLFLSRNVWVPIAAHVILNGAIFTYVCLSQKQWFRKFL